MRTLEEIKEEYAIDQGFNNWDSLLFFWTQEDIHECNNHINEISKRYALEVAKESLKNASEKSQEMRYFIDSEDTDNKDFLNLKHRRSQTCYAVPKQSILSETNIPELK